MHGGEERFRAVLDPLDREPGPLRQRRRHILLAVAVDLHAEAAATSGGIACTRRLPRPPSGTQTGMCVALDIAARAIDVASPAAATLGTSRLVPRRSDRSRARLAQPVRGLRLVSDMRPPPVAVPLAGAPAERVGDGHRGVPALLCYAADGLWETRSRRTASWAPRSNTSGGMRTAEVEAAERHHSIAAETTGEHRTLPE